MANLSDLTTLVAEKMDITKKDAKEAIQTVFEVVADQMATGEPVRVPGFGTFEKVEKAARIAKNPQTGAEISVPAHGAAKFKPASALKDALR